MDYFQLELMIGAKIRVFTIDEEIFEGYFQHWDKSSKNGRLILKNAYSVNKKKFTSEVVKIFNYDIQKVEEIEQINEANNVLTYKKQSLNGSITSSGSFRTKSLSESIYDDGELLYTSRIRHDTEQSFFNKKNNIDLSKYKHYLICDYGSSASILKTIFREDVKLIALKIFTNKWARYGKISVICISVKDWTYIFDVKSISLEDDEGESEESFIQLLKKYLSNPKITKVMHNSCLTSDMLFYKYKISLNHVFDINAACKKIYPDVNDSMLEFENLIEEFLPDIEENKISNKELQMLDWEKRPLNRSHKYHLLRQTACLLNLFIILKDRLIEDFQKTCDLNLIQLRECQNEEKVNTIYNQSKNFGCLPDLIGTEKQSFKTHPIHSSSIRYESSDNTDQNETLSVTSESFSTSSKLKSFLNDVGKKQKSTNSDSQYSNDSNRSYVSKPKNELINHKSCRFIPSGMNASNY